MTDKECESQIQIQIYLERRMRSGSSRVRIKDDGTGKIIRGGFDNKVIV